MYHRYKIIGTHSISKVFIKAHMHDQQWKALTSSFRGHKNSNKGGDGLCRVFGHPLRLIGGGEWLRRPAGLSRRSTLMMLSLLQYLHCEHNSSTHDITVM